MSEELKVSKIMKSLMEDRKETLISLSKKTGVPKSTLSEWLGNRTPNPLQAIKVANYFGVSLHHLLFGSEDKSEPLAKILKDEFFSGTFEISIKRVRIQK